MDKMRISDIQDIQVIIDDADKRIIGTPNVFELDEMLEAMRPFARGNVYAARKNLKKVMRRAHKKTGMIPRNPWWMPKEFRRRY